MDESKNNTAGKAIHELAYFLSNGKVRREALGDGESYVTVYGEAYWIQRQAKYADWGRDDGR